MLKISTLFLLSFSLFAQKAEIIGKVIDKINHEPIIGAIVRVQNQNQISISDTSGMYKLNVPLNSTVSIEVSYIGYQKKHLYNTEIIQFKNYIDIELEQVSNSLEEVVIRGADFHKTIDSPVSLKNLSASEIEKMPGGLRDISRVLQAFPGIAVAPAWRNDLIVRGGGSYENKFFLDGIPIPNINHFTPQGSSGGAYGIINPNYLKGIDFFSGAFPSNRGNALSSVIELKLKDGNPNKRNIGFVMGSTDLSVTSDGFIGKKATYLSSIRLSNWNFVSKTFGLPILPKYDDYLVKLKFTPSKKTEIILIGIGTNDYVEPNLKTADGPFVNKEDQEVIATINTYLRQISINKQNTHTFGAIVKRYFKESNMSISASRYFLNNILLNHTNQSNRTDENKTIDYSSEESQNTLRVEYNKRIRNKYNFNSGLSLDKLSIDMDNFSIIPQKNVIDTIRFKSKIAIYQYSFFSQISHSFKRLDISFGVRADGSNYNKYVSNPLNQISPRLSLSFRLSDKANINFNSAFYHQTPIFTLLAYKNNNKFENKDSLKFMSCFHNVIGVDFFSDRNLKIGIEFFLKKYNNIPFLKREQLALPNSVSFINQQSLGLEPANSSGFGRSMGIEVLLHQKFWKGYYGILAYTFAKTEYSNNDKYVFANWDYRHIIALTGGKQFRKNFEVGIKIRLSTGSPYTPIDTYVSSLKTVYNINPVGVIDITKLNTERFKFYDAIDIRLEKRFIFKKINIGVFVDVQNVYNTTSPVPPFLSPILNSQGSPITLAQDINRYEMKFVNFKAPFNILPTYGLTINLK